MASFVPNFGTPANFADWTQYAGFDANKPMMGIAPPMTQQAPAQQPVAPTVAQFGERMQNVGSQLSQGNYSNAFKTFVSGAAVPGVKPATVQQNQPKDLDGDGMISDFED